MPNMIDRIANKKITVSNDKSKVTINITLVEQDLSVYDRSVQADNKNVKSLLISEGYEVENIIEGCVINNSKSLGATGEDLSGKWVFSLKGAKKPQPKKKTTTKTTVKTNLTKETKSATVTQEDQQKEDSESVE